jgi:threonine/homoserine/homoserine lactone efflux protein
VFLDTNLTLFIVASLALILTPGQDNIYVITRGIAGGRKVALVSAWGVCCGLVVHTVFAAVGLSAILAQSAVAFSVVKYVGAGYLIYLGVKTLLDRGSFAPPEGREGESPSLKKVFLQGVVSNVLNPKVALFFLAFLPQFVDPGAGGGAPQFLALGAMFVLLSLVVTGVIAFFSGSLGGLLRTRPVFSNVLRWLTGCVLVGLGVRLALQRR